MRRLSITKIGELVCEGRLRRGCVPQDVVRIRNLMAPRASTSDASQRDGRHVCLRRFTVSFFLRSFWAWPSPSHCSTTSTGRGRSTTLETGTGPTGGPPPPPPPPPDGTKRTWMPTHNPPRRPVQLPAASLFHSPLSPLIFAKESRGWEPRGNPRTGIPRTGILSVLSSEFLLLFPTF